MAENTAIEWCDHTFNPWVGCTKVSPACDHCYAEAWAKRGGKAAGVVWGGERRRTGANTWGKPEKWQKRAAEFMAQHGRRQRVFCASLADVFDNQVPDTWRRDLFDLIELTPDLDWLLLTKRIGNVAEMVRVAKSRDWLAGQRNVQLGITICNQPEADRDITKLLAIDAWVRFLSIEPMLGSIYLPQTRAFGLHGFGIHKFGVDWVICGGESGPNARPIHPDWARSLRDQCAAAGVPFLFKQWGEWLPWHQFNEAKIEDPPEQTRFKTLEMRDDGWRDVGYPDWQDTADGHVDDMQCVGRVGKKLAGRLLDGIEHNGFPEVTAC